MARHTQAEFAKICGVTNAYISVNKKRGKVIFSEDGYIDDSIQENAYFLQKCLDKLLKESNEIEKKPEVSPAKTEQSTKSDEKKSNKSITGKDRYELDIQKKALEIEKLKVDTRLQQLTEEQIRGEWRPLTLAKTLVSNLSQTILTSQKDANEATLINISKEARLTGDQLAKLRGKMVESLNQGVDKAITNAMRQLKSLVEEFSIKKEIGEHE